MKIINRGEKEGWSRLDITLSAEEVSKDLSRMYMTLASINGLHPQQGKTAREVCGEALGEAEVTKFIDNEVMNVFFAPAYDEQGIDYLGAPQLYTDESVVEGQPFSFHAQAVIKPRMTLSSYGPVVIDVAAAEVSDEEVDEQIKMLLERNPEGVDDPEQIEVLGDSLVAIKMATTVEGVQEDRLTFDRMEFELGKGNMPDGFDEGVAGMKVGETKMVSYVAPTRAGGMATYNSEVTVLCVLKRVTPELTDEWVEAHFGAFNTAKDLRNAIWAELQQQKQAGIAEYRQYLAATQLADRIEGVIPDAAFIAQMNENTNEFAENLGAQGKTIAQYCEENGVTEQQLQQEFMLRTREELRQELALDALARHEGMEVTEEDMQELYSTMAPGQEAMLAQMLEMNGGMRQARERALRMKANKWAVEHAVAE